MFRKIGSAGRCAVTAVLLAGLASHPSIVGAQGAAPKAPAKGGVAAQKIDAEYTALIKKNLSDARISTDLVDHLPASATVPTPLKAFGHIIGQVGELDHVAAMHQYLASIAKASRRAKYWTIGKTEEGRDMVVLAIADEATIATLDKYKGYLKELTDPRKTTEARAQQLLHTAKPIYWLTSGMHSPELGGPEMLMELAYRLVVDDSPMYNNIRSNVIVFITPVVEPDGRDKVVDTYYFNKKYGSTVGRMGTPYWGKYVAHDNNRDGMGQYLDLTKNITRTFLEWTPQVLHDLHESVTYLYVSTGTGPYNESLDPITIGEWWSLATNEVTEMAKRNVPGVWTYNYYDGWVPNYMFFIAHAHNATGRFYEVQSYGPDTSVVRPGNTTTSREWYRPNPPLASIKWSPRANTNIQESALLITLDKVARERTTFLENYWIKSKNSVNKGRNGPVYGWVIPAGQHAKANAAEAVNDLRTQGLEFHRATSSFMAGKVSVQAGDYIVRADQPYRTLADMYFSLQNYPPDNPSPYDDTGWTFPLMRNVTITAILDSALLKQPMTPISAPVTAAGGITGTGSVVVVENNQDNALVTFRFKFGGVKMAAAEADFDAAGHHFGAGALVISNANVAQLDPALKALGLSGYAMASAPSVKMHDLDLPRIGYVHSWGSTQDEGWVRAALDHYGVPYDYFGEPKLKEGNLRAKYDVILYPSGGQGAGGGGAGGRGGGGGGGGGGAGGAAPAGPVPYKRTAEFPALGTPDSTDDMRASAGPEGMKALYEFVQQGGTLITEGSTTAIFPNYALTPGVRMESPPGVFARGTILRGVITDKSSPLMYGYKYNELPIYFSSGSVLTTAPAPAAGAADAGGGRGGRGNPLAANVTPMANKLTLSGWDPAGTGTAYGALPVDSAAAGGGRGGRGGGAGGAPGGAGGRGAGGAPGAAGAPGGAGGRGAGGAGAAAPTLPGVMPDPTAKARVIMQFPDKAADMLLSGTLANGEGLQGKAQLVDESIGKGHMVLFAFRPYWRWQTQGTFAIGFNAIMNWNHLDAGNR